MINARDSIEVPKEGCGGETPFSQFVREGVVQSSGQAVSLELGGWVTRGVPVAVEIPQDDVFPACLAEEDVQPAPDPRRCSGEARAGGWSRQAAREAFDLVRQGGAGEMVGSVFRRFPGEAVEGNRVGGVPTGSWFQIRLGVGHVDADYPYPMTSVMVKVECDYGTGARGVRM